MNYLDVHVARTKMKLKNSNHCLSTVSTLWKGEVILCTVDNIRQSILNVFCSRTIQPNEFATLEGIVMEFIFGDDYGTNKHKLFQ